MQAPIGPTPLQLLLRPNTQSFSPADLAYNAINYVSACPQLIFACRFTVLLFFWHVWTRSIYLRVPSRLFSGSGNVTLRRTIVAARKFPQFLIPFSAGDRQGINGVYYVYTQLHAVHAFALSVHTCTAIMYALQTSTLMLVPRPLVLAGCWWRDAEGLCGETYGGLFLLFLLFRWVMMSRKCSLFEDFYWWTLFTFMHLSR